jgi:hypothetical protein
MYNYAWGERDLVGEFTIRVAAEQCCTYLREQLLSDQLQAGLQGVADLKHKQQTLHKHCSSLIILLPLSH